jgi:hypothetical protein
VGGQMSEYQVRFDNAGFRRWVAIRENEEYKRDTEQLKQAPWHKKYLKDYPHLLKNYEPYENETFIEWYDRNIDVGWINQNLTEETKAEIAAPDFPNKIFKLRKKKKTIPKKYRPTKELTFIPQYVFSLYVEPNSEESDFFDFYRKWKVILPVPPEIKYPHPAIVECLFDPIIKILGNEIQYTGIRYNYEIKKNKKNPWRNLILKISLNYGVDEIEKILRQIIKVLSCLS